MMAPASASDMGNSAPDCQPVELNERGHPATTVRDAEQRLLYPGVVPPATTSPGPPGPLISNLQQDQPRIDKLTGSSAEAAPEREKFSQADHERPKTKRPARPVGKKWATEMPRRGVRKASLLPPAIQRAGTNLPELNRATWDENFSESDSSPDDEQQSSPASGRAGPGGDAQPSKTRPRRATFDDHYRRFRVGNENYQTKGSVSKKDGRLNISVKDTSNTGYLAKALGMAVKKVIPKDVKGVGEVVDRPASARLSSASTTADMDNISCPKLNIVIMVIGSRGDAQPFLKIGKVLKEQYGHRVRIATHPAFREFVEKDSGLEFFSVGGDPSELMAFMVKNPGMIPSLETVKSGDIGKRRAAMAEMFQGFWRACINATDNEKDVNNLKMMGSQDPFVADAIIANPPSFAHQHCAEALGVPLHLMFTFPYTPTQAFPHPLATIKHTNVELGYANFISYPLVEMMVWQGLGDLVNHFRAKTLGLDPVSTLWAPGATYRLHVPFTYLWSPALVPKPEDWGDEIDISGFVFLDLASSFTPPDALTRFLDAGEAPIYIGFGSIVVDDANKFTEMIFEAVKLAGVRALVSKGWGGLGGDSPDVPENIFLLNNTPHDWLFPRVQACVIHGGAGTTAMALKCGKPTFIVPFFGDQHFWGSMVGSAKAGPEAVPYKHLSAEKLAEGIKYCLTEEAVKAAGEIARNIEREGDGAENACRSFHRHLSLSGQHSMRCSILENQVATWQLKKTSLRLSPIAADCLVENGYISWRKLRLLRHTEWNDFEGPGEPVTGVAGSLMGTLTNVFGGIGGVPYRFAKSTNKRKEKKQKKKQAQLTSEDEGAGQDQISKVQTTTTNALRRTATQNTTSAIENPAEELAVQVGRGAYKSAAALARAPVDLSIALAQGFHNAPRLYGDDTVRRPPRVTGIRSGFRAAGHEFVYGIYDGWTGLVRLPVRGARHGGVGGLVSGVGMGLTGWVLKDIAAIIGPVGYSLKGLVKQVERGKQPTKFIRRARIVQGQRLMRALPERERESLLNEVIRGWEVMRALWEAIEIQEREKGGLTGRLGISARGRRGKGAAFESVEVAKRVLAAVKSGHTVESVIGKEIGRKSVESTYEKHKKKEKQRKSQDNKRKGKLGDGEGHALRKPHDRASSKHEITEPGMAEDIGESHALPVGKDFAGRGEHGDDETIATSGEPSTPVEDAKNPFAPDSDDIAKNKTETELDEFKLNGKALGASV